jgi:hypothetical protein
MIAPASPMISPSSLAPESGRSMVDDGNPLLARLVDARIVAENPGDVGAT